MYELPHEGEGCTINKGRWTVGVRRETIHRTRYTKVAVYIRTGYDIQEVTSQNAPRGELRRIEL